MFKEQLVLINQEKLRLKNIGYLIINQLSVCTLFASFIAGINTRKQ